jgi:MSHA biogenesis protein MshP
MTASAQRGFTIVSAIFILVVLAALAAFAMVISTTQQIGSALDLQGARAYQAARAGIEWGTWQVWNSSPASRSLANCASASSSFTPTAPTLSAFKVTVTCNKATDPNGGPTVFSITAVACNQPAGGVCPGNAGGQNYVERRITVTI